MLNKLRACLNDERGQGMVEYGLILILIAAVIVTAVTSMGDGIEEVGESVGSVVREKAEELAE